MEDTLGKRIIANRKRIGLTQDKLAEKLGVTAQAVSKWENDQSCPDITMLPKLAEIFGISTDALLGIEKGSAEAALESELMDDGDGETDRDGKWEMHWNAGRTGGISFAVWVLASGVLLLISNLMQWEANLWDILWPTAMLVFGLFGTLRRFSFFHLGCTLFGSYFLLTNLGLMTALPGKEILLPALIVLLGLSLLADALKSKKKPGFTISHNGKRVYSGRRKDMNTEYRTGEDSFVCSVSFGSDNRRVELAQLAGGTAVVSFGELTVDLTECGEIKDGCRIQADCSFGNLRLLLPRSCRVNHASDTAFANVSFRGHPDPDAKTVVYLDCDVSFGQVTVCYE